MCSELSWHCQLERRQEPLVAPCRCRGSMRGVHARLGSTSFADAPQLPSVDHLSSICYPFFYMTLVKIVKWPLSHLSHDLSQSDNQIFQGAASSPGLLREHDSDCGLNCRLGIPGILSLKRFVKMRVESKLTIKNKKRFCLLIFSNLSNYKNIYQNMVIICPFGQGGDHVQPQICYDLSVTQCCKDCSHVSASVPGSQSWLGMESLRICINTAGVEALCWGVVSRTKQNIILLTSAIAWRQDPALRIPALAIRTPSFCFLLPSVVSLAEAHMRECLEQLQDELGTLGLRRVANLNILNWAKHSKA